MQPLQATIHSQQAEIDELIRTLEHMNDVFTNVQRAQFGQSSEQKKYVRGKAQFSIFNGAEEGQDHKAEDPEPDTILVEAHHQKRKAVRQE